MQSTLVHGRRNELRDLPECAFLLTLPLEIPITDDDFTPPNMDLSMEMAVISDLAIFGHQPECYWNSVPEWLRRLLADKKYGYHAMSIWHINVCANYRIKTMPVLCRHFGIDKGDLFFPHVHRLAELPRELWPNQSRYSKKQFINWLLQSLRAQINDDPAPSLGDIAHVKRNILNSVDRVRRELGIKIKNVQPPVMPTPARPV